MPVRSGYQSRKMVKHSVYIPSRIEVYVRPDLGWMIRFACIRYLYRWKMHNILFKQLFSSKMALHHWRLGGILETSKGQGGIPHLCRLSTCLGGVRRGLTSLSIACCVRALVDWVIFELGDMTR